ncbi:LTA synthase family protein [Peptostreptococcus stomatis]|uniref:LTA synthase family protein n=1 Tax=Peptostreptococcus stomatis TaxID=341694 RepID=UPI0028E768AB|nr:LTA synthase family protein [Peptostreptococcus stomatis]
MPLSPYDLVSYKEALNIANVFLDARFMVAGLAFLALVIILSIVSFRSFKTANRIRNKSDLGVLLVVATIFLIVVPQLKAAKIVTEIAWDPGLSYETNGLVFSFVDETFMSIRKKPHGYSKDSIEAIRSDLDKEVKKDKRLIRTGDDRPDIIFVQLEGFMDPTRLKGCNYNIDPMPNLRKMMDKHTSGLMNVPVTGGGTARTEYEVMSGFNFDYLNQGEIPYQTFLAKRPSISIASQMRSEGYKSKAIHNFNSSFYNRREGYENIGYQKFISLETMTNVEHTPMWWPKDKILTRYIMGELNQDKGKSMIFTISTQGHSKYPTSNMDMDYKVKLVDSKLAKQDQNQINYYANQVYEMDLFVRDLKASLDSRKKNYVLVVYGDHLPALNIITRNMSGVDKFSSLFAVIDNMGIKKKTVQKDLQGYQLSTMVMDLAGLKYGPMNMVHAYLKDKSDYQEKLKLVQYDILFGKRYFLKESEEPIKNNKMQLGTRDMKLESVEKKDGKVYIKGQGINRNTRLYIGGEEAQVYFVDDKTLLLKAPNYKGKKIVYLEILDSDEKPIYRSNTLVYKF